MLAPDCVLVRRTPSGFRCLAPDEAAAIKAAILGPGSEPDWLFEQTRRTSRASRPATRWRPMDRRGRLQTDA